MGVISVPLPLGRGGPQQSPTLRGGIPVPAIFISEKQLVAATTEAVSLKVKETCTSCGVRLIGQATTSFLCPNCGEGKLGRCAQCRDQSVEYLCAHCGFVGP